MTENLNFEDLGLEPKLLQAIHEAGYTTPTPIQIAAIPHALKGRDVLGIAQTGTGKTASFTLPMIQRLAKGRARARMPRTLVLAPTRELAAQVSENFEKYGKHHKLTMALLIGGVSFADQDAKLTRGVDVLIATPGRLLDHFERGRLLLTGIEVMVVDEADRMLDMGFIPDIERIFKLTPPSRQTLFFSATMPPEIQRLTDAFLHAPIRVEVSRPASTADTIAQRIVRVPSKDDRVKRAALRALASADEVKNGIIFCNRKSTVDVVAKSLQTHGYNARPIHGDLAQSFRTETLDKFRSGEIKLLVASDVAARGLDIPNVSHVFNYDVPIHADDYVHRIGRTGRAGRTGVTYMLVTPNDDKAYSAILKTIKFEGIEEFTLDPAIFEAAGRSDDRGGEDRGRSRSGERSRSRDRDRPKTGDGDRETDRSRKRPAERVRRRSAPRDASADGDVDTRDEFIPGAPAATAPAIRTADEAPVAASAPAPRRRSRSADDDPAGGSPVVGMGDHVPAFMRR